MKVFSKAFVAAAIGTGLAVTACAAPGLGQERREVPYFETFGSPQNSAAAADLDAAIEAFRDAWARQDAAALEALHAEDVEWINAYARIIRGNEALRDFLDDRLFPAFDPEVSRTDSENMQMVSLRFIGADAAVAHLYTDSERGASRNIDEAARRTHLHFVYERRGDAWLIVHVAIMDAR